MGGRRRTRAVGAAGVAALVAGVLIGIPAPAQAAVSPTAGVIIDEVYGGGGNAGAPYNRDFIELYNTTAAPISLAGWSVQYKAATGTTWATTALTGSIPARGFYLVGEASGGAVGSALPPTNVTGTTNLSATAGTVALSTASAALTCNLAACATTGAVADLIGYGTATTFAGTGAAPAGSNTTSLSRSIGHQNTASNAVDFAAEAPRPGQASTRPDIVRPVTKTIAEIQGPGDVSPLANVAVTTTGVVTGTYSEGGYRGYTIQTQGTGGVIDLGSHTVSDGLFVFFPTTVPVIPVVPLGDLVQVTGVVNESSGLTEITVADAGLTVLNPDPAPIAPATVSWPATDAQRESLESMLYQPTGDFTVTDTYGTNQYGEVGLAVGTRPLIQPTDAAAPNSPEAAAIVADNAARRVVLNDGASTDFLAAGNGNLTPPYLSLSDPIRVGEPATFTGTSPVIVTYRNNLWKLDPRGPITPAGPYPVTFANTRTAAPDPSLIGTPDVTVASFNVLNYFTTLGTGNPGCEANLDRAGDGVTVKGSKDPLPVGASPCLPRGAWDADDLQRQQDKIVAAINALDADVVGLMEIENSAKLGEAPDEALATLVAALNSGAGAGTWAFVPSSADLPAVSEQDVITNAIIYRPAVVSRDGDSRALGTESGPEGAFGNAREPVGQAFAPTAGGEPFLFVVNHFKSKGSAGPWPGDVDSGDGQGASNESRSRQAQALRDWVPTVQGDVQTVVLAGDFNSYRYEDPLQTLYDAGYTDAGAQFAADKQSYSFDGRSGSLDHILVNRSGLARATGADIWNINSGESVALEYSRYNYHGTLFYAPDQYRSSDHDPVLLGLINEQGPQPLTSVLADITTAYSGGRYVNTVYVGPGPEPTTGRDDPSKESTLGNLVANFLVTTLSPAKQGGAGIGVINPGALDGELLLEPDGVVTDAEAAAVLPDTSTLRTLSLTGAQFTALLEEQWRPDGSFLALGLSENVTYTYDSTAAAGARVTSVAIDDTTVDPAATYRIGTTSYLASGGDGFDVLAQGSAVQDTGLRAQQTWLDYLGTRYGLEANYARQGVEISDLPTLVAVGGTLDFTMSNLDLTSLGSPQNTRMAVNVDGARIVQVPVSGGAASVSVSLPGWVGPGAHVLTLRAKPSGTLVTIPLVVRAP